MDREGIRGLQEKLTQKKKNGVWRFFINTSNKLMGWENALNLWVEIDNISQDSGWGEASKFMLSKMKIEIDAGGDVGKIKRNKKATLVVGINHEAILEPFILAALLGKRRSALVSLKVLQLLGKGYKKYILPVMPRRYAVDEKRFAKWIVNKVHPRGRFYGIEQLRAVEIDEMNEKVFEQSVKKLEDGEDVILFAPGGKVVQSSWGRSSGEIICRINKKKIKDVRVAFFKFGGITQLETARRFWKAANGRGMEKLKVKVESREGFGVEELKNILGDNFNPKGVVEYLKMWSLEEFGYNKVVEKKIWNFPKIIYQPAYAKLMTLLTFIRVRL